VIKAIVCDGRKGLVKLFPNIPTQMCQFHQAAIIKKIPNQKPKTDAGKELKAFMKLLTKPDKESFVGGLNEWYGKWEAFLKRTQ